MKVPFREQISDYDCVPTTFINALIYLFKREEIPPIVIHKTYLYCLDYDSSSHRHGHGTTGCAVKHLGEWLENYKDKNYQTFALETEFITGSDVHLGPGNKIARCLNENGVALINIHSTKKNWHYILGIKSENSWLHCFDPSPKKSIPGAIQFERPIDPQGPNLKISYEWIDTFSNSKKYVLGSKLERECLLLRRPKK